MDTGVSVDDLRYSPAIAGGGTPADDPETPLGSLRRIWFFDLSAGPEINHWNLTTADLDGDGIMDWRLPPIWEYGNPNAYRPLNTLSSDHGRIARFVAIDSLFTTSAAFPVSLSPPRLPSSIQFDVNMFQGNTARNGLALFSSAETASKATALQPYNHFSVEVNEFLFAGGAKAAPGGRARRCRPGDRRRPGGGPRHRRAGGGSAHRRPPIRRRRSAGDPRRPRPSSFGELDGLPPAVLGWRTASPAHTQGCGEQARDPERDGARRSSLTTRLGDRERARERAPPRRRR